MAAQTQLQEQQSFFDLFDSYWFFNKTKNPPSQIPKIQQKSITETTQILDFSAVPTINIRSYSDQLFMTSNQQSSISDSPNSVLKEIEEKETILPVAESKKSLVKENNKGKKRHRKSKSKSLSELEFEEVKGFMDLGFIFSEKDKDTNLVSIIPGLQRLGRDEKEEKVGGYVGAVSRPYLSEAWEKNIREEEEEEEEEEEAEAVRSIKIPAIGNEVEVKNQLRFWAHSVASTVR